MGNEDFDRLLHYLQRVKLHLLNEKELALLKFNVQELEFRIKITEGKQLWIEKKY